MAWKHLYSKSLSNYGTLAFFTSQLQRLSVSKEPKKSVDATIEFLDTVVKGHWLACACDILGISSLEEKFVLPSHVAKGSPGHKLAFVQGIAKKIVDQMCLVDSAFLDSSTSTSSSLTDGVFNYTQVLCHYGALVTEFYDA